MKEIRKFAMGGGRSNSLLPRFLIVSLIVISSLCSLFVSCDDTLKLQSIKVTTKPTAEYQYLGESLDKTGMVVTGYYNKGYESVISDYTVSPVKFETLGINTVTVSYQGMTDSFEVNVIANTLESISIKNPPNKIAYEEGDKLNLTGLVVEANYKDGTVKTITGYTTSPKEGATLTTADKKVVISYQSKTTEQSIVVVETPTPVVTYTVSFDSQGGSTVNEQVVLSGSWAIEPTNLTKEKYGFMGWYKEDTYVNKYDFSTPVTANLTLYAKWLKLNPIGGRVFYMHDDNGATYTFFDSNKHVFDGTPGYELVLKNSNDINAIYDYDGNWSKVAYYAVENKGQYEADKFYVFGEYYSEYPWTYYDTNASKWKYELLGLTEDSIGSGKTNTATILAKKPEYVVIFEYNSYWYETIWYKLNSLNTAGSGTGTEGCNDWFIGSRAEYEKVADSGLNYIGYGYTSVEVSAESVYDRYNWITEEKNYFEGFYSLRAF